MLNKIKIDKTSFVSPDCKLIGNITIGKNCEIHSSTLENCVIKNNVIIKNSYIEKSIIKDDVTIGPYSHIRPNCILNENVHIGNFVEVKNSNIGKRTKIPHLSYVGDCDMGEDVNVGCGVIFCNYDGLKKYRSKIGDRVFIGSNSNIISPVIIDNDGYVAAGSTITKDIFNGNMAISRTKQENKFFVNNPYIFNFIAQPQYFGTDGIRGIYGKDLTDKLCTKIGYALGKLNPNAKVLIGRDTRPSGEIILEKLAYGLSQFNTKIYDAKIISTPGLAYLTKSNGFDFGIEITASHNPNEYNGIKIFDKNGYKINKNLEKIIENQLFFKKNNKKTKIIDFDKKEYIDFLSANVPNNLEKIKIFIDCANGASSNYAKEIFKKSGAEISLVNNYGEINKNASVLNKEIFTDNFKKSNCNIGFCFDGDADRVMCVTKDGIFDGDRIMYILAKYFQEKSVVGTVMTNMGIEKALNKNGINLYRVDVGDRNIAKLLKQKDYNIGAEESGHVIIRKLHTTGDGILTALVLLKIYNENKNIFEEASKIKLFAFVQEKIKTDNKQILNDLEIKNFIEQAKNQLGDCGRIISRASGTEPAIRIIVEHIDEKTAKEYCIKLKNYIQSKLDDKKMQV